MHHSFVGEVHRRPGCLACRPAMKHGREQRRCKYITRSVENMGQLRRSCKGKFAVSGLRMVAGPKGKVIAAGKSGKFKTASTMVGLCVMMLLPQVEIVGIVVMVMIVATTVYSGVEYFVQNWNCLWD